MLERRPTVPPGPTRARFVVLGLLCLLSGILYLDRICMSAAIDSIQTDLGLTNTESSYVLMAFTLAYGLFEVPTGRWGDRIGARRVLTRISLWWSAFTAMTGACTGLWTLVGVRFLFGAGEAGAFPNVARVLSRWFPDEERGRAQGVLLASSSIGGALAPFLAAVMIQAIGWRWTFAAFGGVGAAWAAGFWWWFRDDPAAHPAVDAAELAHIGRRATSGAVHTPIPWAAVVRNPSIRSLGLIMALGSFNSYIYFSWYPKYLKDGRHIDPTEAGLMASMVLAIGAVGTLVGGLAVDRFVARGGGTSGRRIMGGAAFFAASACARLCPPDARPLDRGGLHRAVVPLGPGDAAALVVVRDRDQRPSRRRPLRADEHGGRLRCHELAVPRRGHRRRDGGEGLLRSRAVGPDLLHRRGRPRVPPGWLWATFRFVAVEKAETPDQWGP